MIIFFVLNSRRYGVTLSAGIHSHSPFNPQKYLDWIF
jgi:hypothetical protein